MKENMTEYQIHHESDREALVKRVNESIAEGWEPLGGLCYESWKGWAQAMIRRDFA